MTVKGFKFDRMEFAGSLGDLGTLLPLSVGMMVVNGLSVTTVLMMVAFFYIFSGIYFRLPIPVQPLKVVAAIAIGSPGIVTQPVIAASGILFGLVLLFLSVSGLVDRLAKLFTRPVMRGIQLGLGFILMTKGIRFIMNPEMFIRASGEVSIGGLPLNPLIGVIMFFVTLMFLSSRRFPAALVLVGAGIFLGCVFGNFDGVSFSPGPSEVSLVLPSVGDFYNALVLLVIPQIPLTLGNAVMGTADTCYTLFGRGEDTSRVSYKAFALSMSLVNMAGGMLGAMPMCHGAGGLAAHHRFGARTGGSNLMIGGVFLALGLFFGKIGISLLSMIPHAVLGILLLFAGLELALFIRDIKDKRELFVAVLIAGVGFATSNMALALVVGVLSNSVIPEDL